MFDPNSECFAKYDALCSRIFDYAYLRRKTYCYRKGSKLWKNCIHQKHFKKWLVGGCIASHPSTPAHKLQKPSKESGMVQSLGTISSFNQNSLTCLQTLIWLLCSLFMPKESLSSSSSLQVTFIEVHDTHSVCCDNKEGVWGAKPSGAPREGVWGVKPPPFETEHFFLK